ncbi:acyltransferase domain-containing protein [Streptomyces sp. NPDC058701]|uniref:acyltransferase domain-containing protein n=1 Tax=Streptomyces sp. NPDC058701 TaxID=3346608 RepID=UPI003665A225
MIFKIAGENVAGSVTSMGAVAIVGIGCRYPGAHGVEQLWQVLRDGISTVGLAPTDRPTISHLREMSSPGRFGGYIEGVEDFDPAFFGISPREAAKLDPQKRILLETVWEAFEDAGIPPSSLAGSDTGVIVGEQATDFWDLVRSEDCDLHTFVGSQQRAAIPGRVSYFFDFRGPSVSVEAACAASLVAVYLAAEHIRTGKSQVCVAAGSNVILVPDSATAYGGAGALSDDGRCKFGDASADGFTRSEGVASLILKDLASAQADGDRIYAVIRGGATGHDGKSSGNPMRPSAEGQAAVLRAAYEDAGIDPAAVDYVEAHGTGTPLGDAAELTALGEVIGCAPGRHRPLLVGSLKTNVGHSEAAAGIGGVIKAALSLREQRVPASLHLREPNPQVAWEQLRLRIPTEPMDLSAAPGFRYAGVSAFGISGTNAHVVLERFDGDTEEEVAPVGETAKTPFLLPLSAHSPEALRALAADYAAFLGPDGEGRATSLQEICSNAAIRRDHQLHRLAVVGADHDELVTKLTDLAVSETAFSNHDNRLTFVFSGHGSQWVGMARELLKSSPVFAASLAESDRAIADECGWSVLELLHSDDPSYYLDVDRAHPSLFAVQTALHDLLVSWGLLPDAVLGHSLGEVSAARAAGALSLEGAAKVICRRSELMSRVVGQGAMAWVGLPAAEVEAEIVNYGDKLVVAVINDPSSVVISGDPQAVAEACAVFERRDVFCRLIKIDVAAHSPQLAPFIGEITEALEDIEMSVAGIQMYSSVFGSKVPDGRLGTDYWGRNLRETVRFSDAVRALLDEGPATLVEIAPHPVVLPSLQSACSDDDIALACQRREKPQYAALLETVGQLWARGHAVDWPAIFEGRPRPLRLPSYPWQRDKFPLPETDPIALRKEGDLFTFFGNLVERVEGDSRRWEGALDVRTHGYLLQHRVNGRSVLAGAVYVELIAQAVARMHGNHPVTLTNVVFVEPLVLDPTTPPHLRIVLEPEGSHGSWNFTVAGTDENGRWNAYATGRVRLSGDLPDDRLPDITVGSTRTAKEFYEYWDRRGNQWQGAFRALKEIRSEAGKAVGAARLGQQLPGGRYRYAPPLLDACLQLAVAAITPAPGAPEPERQGAVVAASIDRIDLRGDLGTVARCLAHTVTTGNDTATADLRITDGEGRVHVVIEGMNMRVLSPGRQTEEAEAAPGPVHEVEADALVDSLYEVAWEPATAPVSRPDGRLLVLADQGGLGAGLAARHAHVLVTHGPDFRRLAEDQWQVSDNPADFTRLMEQVGPLTGVLHLWGLDVHTLEQAEGPCLTGTISLIRALDAYEGPNPVLTFVTRGAQPAGETCTRPEQALVWGLARTLRNEHPQLRILTVDLDPAGRNADSDATALLGVPGTETEVAFRDGVPLVPRLRRRRSKASPRATAEMSQPPAAIPATTPPRQGHVTVRTAYVGVNFHDVLASYAALEDDGPQGTVLGWECSGTVTALGPGVCDLRVGDEVVALAQNAFAPEVTVQASLTCRIPGRLNMAEAATYPTAYVTAYLALMDAARLQEGESVLIHSAAGGVGLAALRIAAWRGARVYATAGTPEKRALLRYLGAEYVADSRSAEFVKEIRSVTGGVDVILNTTLSGDGWVANAELLAPYGRLVDITKRDALAGHHLPLNPGTQNVSYTLLDVGRMQDEQPERLGRALGEVMDLCANGVLPPLPYRTFPRGQESEAFALMARSGHIGKLLIEQNRSSLGAEDPAGEDAASAAPSTKRRPPLIRPDMTYLITGGLGALGLEVARWLVSSGARHILLTGHSPLPTLDDHSERNRALHALQDRANVHYAQADAADPQAMRAALDAWQRAGGPSVCGIVHTAGVLHGCEIAALTPETYTSVLRPKAYGARVLTEVLDLSCMDFVWFFSAGSAILGLPFIGAYASANAYLDALAHQLRMRGVPASSINWGYWANVGMAARKERELGRSLVPEGMWSFTPPQALGVLEDLLRNQSPQTAVLPTDWGRWQTGDPHAANSSLFFGLVPWHAANASRPPDTPSLALRASERRSPAGGGYERPMAPAPAVSLPTQAEGEMVTTVTGDTDAFLHFIREQVGQILGVSADRVQAARPLNAQGLDSLLTMELRVRIEKAHGITVPTAELFTLTPKKLASLLADNAAPEATLGSPL